MERKNSVHLQLGSTPTSPMISPGKNEEGVVNLASETEEVTSTKPAAKDFVNVPPNGSADSSTLFELESEESGEKLTRGAVKPFAVDSKRQALHFVSKNPEHGKKHG